MAEPTLEELLAYQDKRAQDQQAQQAQRANQPPADSGFAQLLSSLFSGKGNAAGQPLAPVDQQTGQIRPRTLMDIIFSRR